MHPNVIGKGCIDNLVDENEFTKRLHLKDCGLFIRNIEHTYQNRTKNMNNNNNNNNNSRTSSIIESIEFEDNVNKGKDIIKLQTMSLKSTLDRIGSVFFFSTTPCTKFKDFNRISLLTTNCIIYCSSKRLLICVIFFFISSSCSDSLVIVFTACITVV